MDESSFWEIVESARDKPLAQNENELFERLREYLLGLSIDDVADFQRILEEKELELYRNDLWAVAYIIQHGCSDDGFDDFRNWVISQGKAFFDRVLADPTYIADVVEPGAELSNDSLWHAARNVYEEKTGNELPPFVTYTEDRRAAGTTWDESDLPRLYPKVWEKFA
jgi:Protein of unknown function (DUF4240)